jgi:hypothetical protein
MSTARLVRTVLVLVLAVFGAGAATATASPRTPSSPVIILCGGQHEARPHQVVLACADANWGVAKLHWRRWGARRAIGHGVGFANTCVPNCASGQFVHFRVRVVARRLMRTPQGLRYTLLRVHAFRRPPADLPRTAIFRLTRFGPDLVG